MTDGKNASRQRQSRGPWAWRKFGRHWSLVEDFGPRRVVLDAWLDNHQSDWDSPGCPMLVTCSSDGVLVPITPDHPAAKVIAAAPGLLEACRAALPILKSHIHPDHFDGHAARVMVMLRDAIEKATRGEVE